MLFVSHGPLQLGGRAGDMAGLPPHGWLADGHGQGPEGFSQRPRRPGMDQVQLDAGIDLRRRGMTARNREAARAAARGWQEEQSQA